MISTLIGQFRALGLSLQESLALAGMSARYQAQADAFAAGRAGLEVQRRRCLMILTIF
jgi:hypothetical protein